MHSDDRRDRLQSINRHVDRNSNVNHRAVGDIINDTTNSTLRNSNEQHHHLESTNHSPFFLNINEHTNAETRLTPSTNFAQHGAPTSRFPHGESPQTNFTPTGDTASNYNTLARYLLDNRTSEQIPMNPQQVLSSRQIAFLQMEEMRLNPSLQFINIPAFRSRPYDEVLRLYQQQQLINLALQQIHLSNASFARIDQSMEADNSLQAMASMQRQSAHIPLAAASQLSNARHIWVDPSAAIAHFQHNAVVNNRQHSNERAVVMSTPLQRSASIQFPLCIAHSDDKYNLSSHQQYLRRQIEAFQADEEDVLTYVRGRNRPIQIGQIGIRCRHCVHVKITLREKGSMYYPANIMGIYQAAQNMSTSHIQCGRCPSMPNSVKEHFKSLIATKSSSNGAGRRYWADRIREEMNLIDTEHGIFQAL